MSDWGVKLALLCISFLLLVLAAASRWNRNRIYLLYFLAFLFSLTGFSYDLNVEGSVIRTSFAEIIYLGLLLVMLLGWLSNMGMSPRTGLERPVKLYLTCAAIGIVTATYYEVRPVNVLIEVKSYVLYVFYLYLIPTFVTKKEDVIKCLWALVIFSIIPMIYALPSLSALDPLQHERGQIGISWGALNVLVGYILPVVFVGFTLVNLNAGIVNRGILILLIGIYVCVLFFSETRSGWIAFSISLLTFGLLAKKIRQIAMAGMVVALIIVISGESHVFESIVKHRIIEQTIEQPDSSLEKRLERWEIAKRTFMAHPVFGSGWGGYLLPLGAGGTRNASVSLLPRWHNSFYELLSQLGIVGMFCFFWIWYRVGRMSIARWRSTKDLKDRVCLAGLISAGLSCLIYSFGEQQLFAIETASVSWFVVGLLVAYLQASGSVNMGT
jgi:O-antigen ligase